MGKNCPTINLSNKAVELIPISASKKYNKTIRKNSKEAGGLNAIKIYPMSKMQRFPYLSDPQLIPRVQKYLESNIDKTYVDIGLMADELQSTYREYSKRKRAAFRASVKKAYSIVLRSYGMGETQNGSSSEEELEESEEENLRSDQFHNSLNDQLVNLYARSNPAKKIDENELIDISSEDSEAEANNKTSNGPSTSNKNEIKQLFSNPSLEILKEKLNTGQGKKRRLEYTEWTMPSNKKKKSLATLQEPSVSFKDVAGIEKTLIDITKLLIHIKHSEVYRQIGISPPRGFLLHGPPGCGKTLLANAIAGELGVPLLKVAAPELVAGISGESEERIRELFERAIMSTPCVLFIDEIDAITANRQNAHKDMERRIVAQLISCLDDLNQNINADRVILIGATNRPDSMDPALRRAGRFDREIKLGIPDEKSRIEILKLLTCKLRLEQNFDWHFLGTITPGYVGADLVSLTSEAGMVAVNRIFSVLEKLHQKNIELSKSKDNLKAKIENEDNKIEPEIIVDEDPKEIEENKKNKDDLVLIIEDDNSKQGDETAETVALAVAEATSTVIPKLEENKTNTTDNKESRMIPEPIDESIESYSSSELQENLSELATLEDFLKLLHSSTPVNQKDLETVVIVKEDFEKAAGQVQPSAKREGFATVPDVSWKDVGSLKDIRQELMMSIVAPTRYKEQCKALGISIPAGVLLCGPPGCGKTLVAKAIANEAGINFISVKGPELLNMYVGESEKAVRTCFQRARNSAPCVIFFDELDALCPKRSDSREGGATMRVVNQMLTEMDGIEGREGVFLLAATNRPDIVDPAVLRPGRFDKLLYVGLPSSSDRVEILKTITKNGTEPSLSPDVNLDLIGESDELSNYTSADLAGLVREAARFALQESMMHNTLDMRIVVNSQHFVQAIAKIRPSVSEKDRKHYEKMRKLYTACPQNEVEEMELS